MLFSLYTLPSSLQPLRYRFGLLYIASSVVPYLDPEQIKLDLLKFGPEYRAKLREVAVNVTTSLNEGDMGLKVTCTESIALGVCRRSPSDCLLGL